MAYGIYYPTGCNSSVANHYCNDCETAEHARLRSVAFISKDFEFTDPSDPDEWEQGVADKKNNYYTSNQWKF